MIIERDDKVGGFVSGDTVLGGGKRNSCGLEYGGGGGVNEDFVLNGLPVVGTVDGELRPGTPGVPGDCCSIG